MSTRNGFQKPGTAAPVRSAALTSDDYVAFADHYCSCLLAGEVSESLNYGDLPEGPHRVLAMAYDCVRNELGRADQVEIVKQSRQFGEPLSMPFVAKLMTMDVPHGAEYYAGHLRDWSRARKAQLIPERAAERIRSGDDPIAVIDDLAQQIRDFTSGTETTIAIPFYDGPALAQLDVRIEYMIADLLAAAQGQLVTAPRKCLKTNTEIDKIISFGSGSPFLGYFEINRPIRAALMSAESGAATIKETAHRIAVSKGMAGVQDCPDSLFAFSTPRITAPAECEHLRRIIDKHQLRYLSIDPTYLTFKMGDSGKNVFESGEMLYPLNRIMHETGCTISLSHHARKANGKDGQPLELGDEAYSGFSEWARQWQYLSRREPYDESRPGSHRLWMRYGGSAGHNGLVGIDIEEGSHKDAWGRKWEVTVREAADVHNELREERSEVRDARKEATLRKNVEKVREALTSFPAGATINDIAAAARVSKTVASESIMQMRADGEAESCSVLKNKRPLDGWKTCHRDNRDN